MAFSVDRRGGMEGVGMNRRGFLMGMLAAGAAPAIVKASSLMPVRKIITPAEFWASMPDYMTATEVLERQRMYSYWASQLVEQMGLAPKHPFIR
jgi:hypothetical protein